MVHQSYGTVVLVLEWYFLFLGERHLRYDAEKEAYYKAKEMEAKRREKSRNERYAAVKYFSVDNCIGVLCMVLYIW